mmetsp:Transcript_5303/g.7821  ORF Transcript_5303/g.7821 Transcript_5303/m.7821 type:complete len:279 (-) Transcript_5303:487-1323(-)
MTVTIQQTNKEMTERIKAIKSKPSRYTATRTYPPVDLSFRMISDITKMHKAEARKGYRKRINKQDSNTTLQDTKKTDDVQQGGSSKSLTIERRKRNQVTSAFADPLADEVEVRKDEEDNEDVGEDGEPKIHYTNYYGNAIKLNNNNIESLAAFEEGIESLMEFPEDLTWVDLSFNLISDLEGLPNCHLSVLNLHGNQLADPRQLFHLRKYARTLQKLTLHGNPLCEMKNYRYFVLSILPFLKSLDFATITRKDLETAHTFEQIYMASPKKRKKKKKEE